MARFISKVVQLAYYLLFFVCLSRECCSSVVKLCGLFSIHFRILTEDTSLTRGPIEENCSSYLLRSYLRAQVMKYAIEEINSKDDFLRNTTLVYEIHDICNRNSVALKASMECLDLTESRKYTLQSPGLGTVFPSEKSPIIIGPDSSEPAMIVSDFLQIFTVPLISYSASSALLSKRDRYRTFFRSVPDDGFQAIVIADIVAHYGWDWVGVVAVDNSYGRSVLRDFIEEAAKRGICIAFQTRVQESIGEDDMKRLFEALQEHPELEIVVAFTYTQTLLPFLERADSNFTPDQALTWIASESWSTSEDIANKNFNILGNVFGPVTENTELPGFREYLHNLNPYNPANSHDKWLKEIWEGEFQCKVQPENVSSTGIKDACADHTLLELYASSSLPSTLYRVYLAVYAAANALNDIESCIPSEGLLEGGLCPDLDSLEPWQLMNYLQHVNFTDVKGRWVYFDDKGGMQNRFKIVQWQSTRKESGGEEIDFVEVGYHDDKGLRMDDKKVTWNTIDNKPPYGICQFPCQPGSRIVNKEGLPSCCFECTACPEGSITNGTGQSICDPCPEGTWSNTAHTDCLPKTLDLLEWNDPTTMICLAVCALGVLCTIGMTVIFTIYYQSPIVRASNRELSYSLLCLLVIAYLEPLFYIGMPSDWSCNIRIALHSLINTGVISLFLIKTRRILVVFDTNNWRQQGFLRRSFRTAGSQVVFLFTLCLIQTLIVTVYLVILPSRVEIDDKTSNLQIYVHCHSNLIAFVVMYSYNALIACVCFAFSFQARKIPENFHETRYITVCMLFYIIIWIVSLPTYFTTTGKLQSMMQIVTVLISDTLILGFMFVPKCYIIFLKPERNTQNALRGQACGMQLSEVNHSLVVNMDEKMTLRGSTYKLDGIGRPSSSD